MELIVELLNGLKLFALNPYFDERGNFCETFRESELQLFGINDSFPQENQSISQKNVLRGLHYQLSPAQGKLIRVVQGKAQFIELDIRQSSETLGQFAEIVIDAEDFNVLWVPPGFANGFLALTDNLIISYKVTNYWNPLTEQTILYNDTDLQIPWLINNPIVSEKDKQGCPFKSAILL
jgi:dTDP-4-dehydrorhamnose 3,5-epimerase